MKLFLQAVQVQPLHRPRPKDVTRLRHPRHRLPHRPGLLSGEHPARARLLRPPRPCRLGPRRGCPAPHSRRAAPERD